MSIDIETVHTPNQMKDFVAFPRLVNRGDPNWVPPLIKEQYTKLDPQKNPFWDKAERALFLAVKEGRPAGRIAAMVDHHRNQVLRVQEGHFGFFDCVDDQQVANSLFKAAEGWLSERNVGIIRGPFNPSSTDECGILVEGFHSRPALLEAHNPVYYSNLIEKCGYSVSQELVARMAVAPSSASDVESVLSEKLLKVVEKMTRRNDVRLRKVNLARWDQDVTLACEIYNRALQPLPGYVPIPTTEFKRFADDFKAILDPDLALLAEVKGTPVGFALALPDITHALQNANGRMGLKAMFHIWMDLRKPIRGTFKILMILPEYQNRGIETILVLEVARAAFAKGYREMDMSLTGSENEKSNRFQENLGYKVYRRYHIYQKHL